MRRTPLLVGGVLVLTAVVFGSANLLLGAQGGGKTVKAKIILPPASELEKPAIVTVDGKEVAGEGDERTITATTAKDKDYVTIVVVFEPNNYTKITRPRKVTASDKEVTIDFRKKSDKELDDIVVRFVPTPPDFIDAMCKLAKVGKEDVVYDLGCGDGRMVIAAVKDFNAKRGVGIDIDADLVKKCKENAKKAGVSEKVQFREGDVLKVDDLSDANVVLLYMGDDINERLKPILKKTLKKGSRVVSHRFLMGKDWPPDESVEVKNTREPYVGYTEKVHLWVIK
jgi:SAM-dependent methyltransferase